MLRWVSTLYFRNYITLWGYFWYFECKWQNNSQNSHIFLIFSPNKNLKWQYFQKDAIRHLNANGFPHH